MYGLDILCGISMGTFEIPLKISHPCDHFWHYSSSVQSLSKVCATHLKMWEIYGCPIFKGFAETRLHEGAPA